jgi:hypothetical protein
MQHLSADEVASVLIARFMREVEYFVANTMIPEGASTDDVWSQFLENLKNGKTSPPDVDERSNKKPFIIR